MRRPAIADNTTKPVKPTLLAISNPTGTSVELDWAAATDHHGIHGYQIYRADTDLGTATRIATTTDTLPNHLARLAVADSYDTYGNPNTTPQPDTFGFGYRGELHIGSLIHLRNRDYNPQTGTFTTTDPLPGVPGTTTNNNPYHYTNNNPTNLTDPTGLRPTDGTVASMQSPISSGVPSDFSQRARIPSLGGNSPQIVGVRGVSGGIGGGGLRGMGPVLLLAADPNSDDESGAVRAGDHFSDVANALSITALTCGATVLFDPDLLPAAGCALAGTISTGAQAIATAAYCTEAFDSRCGLSGAQFVAGAVSNGVGIAASSYVDDAWGVAAQTYAWLADFAVATIGGAVTYGAGQGPTGPPSASTPTTTPPQNQTPSTTIPRPSTPPSASAPPPVWTPPASSTVGSPYIPANVR